MRIKNRSKPLPLQKLDALIPRMPASFPRLPEMKDDARKQGAGYAGELKVDYYLDMLASRYTILDDVSLRTNGKNSQIDSLVIADYSMFIVDAKHYRDQLTFDTALHQLTRSDGEVESGFEYPITQVENQKFHLQNWLQHHHLASIPSLPIISSYPNPDAQTERHFNAQIRAWRTKQRNSCFIQRFTAKRIQAASKSTEKTEKPSEKGAR
ncbi:hypothetical protein GCM10008983_11570 [Lentibacillus halophilus]|uniref:NERD domain-containing protein n=1 Tax=Lentibacillus halophilus TaxID=295065 RepID=A0ABP3J3I4_9BACI